LTAARPIRSVPVAFRKWSKNVQEAATSRRCRARCEVNG